MLKVFYHSRQSVPDNISFSPSAGKPALIAAEFGKIHGVQLCADFRPLIPNEIQQAHDPDFVMDVLEGTRPNGFGNTLKSVAESLPWTTGSFFAAAVHAWETKAVAMSPTSGFHHAGYDSCSGFCTFNGLMIAAILLHRSYSVNRIGIIDFDAHFGNGTDDIIKHLHIDWIVHYTFGEFCYFTDDFDAWLTELEQGGLAQRFRNCDMLLYQAGADPHKDDPLGGFLTTEQMRRRDELVFRFAHDAGIPLVWNLAGGYQKPVQKVIALHGNTLSECLKAYGI